MARTTLASKTATADQRVYWQTVINKLDDLDAAQRGLLTSLRGLDYMANKTKDDLANITNNYTPPHRAAGGPVTAGTAYTVGERGQETFVPATNGTIIPNGGGSSGSMTFVYSPQFSSASAAEAQRFARAVTPELIREFRRQGQL